MVENVPDLTVGHHGARDMRQKERPIPRGVAPSVPAVRTRARRRARASRARKFRNARAKAKRNNPAAPPAADRAIKLTIVEHDGSSGNLHGQGSPRDAGRDKEGQDARHYRELVADRNRRQLQQRVLQNMF